MNLQGIRNNDFEKNQKNDAYKMKISISSDTKYRNNSKTKSLSSLHQKLKDMHIYVKHIINQKAGISLTIGMLVPIKISKIMIHMSTYNEIPSAMPHSWYFL